MIISFRILCILNMGLNENKFLRFDKENQRPNLKWIGIWQSI